MVPPRASTGLLPGTWPSIRRRLGPPDPATTPGRRGVADGSRELQTGLRFVWAEPFLRASLLAASAVQLVVVGAILAPRVQTRCLPHTLIIILGWTTVAAFAALCRVEQPLVAGLLLGAIYLT